MTFVKHIFPFGNDYETKRDLEDIGFVESVTMDNNNELWENHTGANVHEDIEHQLESEYLDEDEDVDLGIVNEDETNTHDSPNRETNNQPKNNVDAQQGKNEKRQSTGVRTKPTRFSEFVMDFPPSLQHSTIVPTLYSSTDSTVHPIC